MTRQLLVAWEPEDGSPRPFAAVTLVTLEHESGKRFSKTRVLWGLGTAPRRTGSGRALMWASVDARGVCSICAARTPVPAELLNSTHVRVEGWAHPDLLGYALDALLADKPDLMFDTERLHVFTVQRNLTPHVVDAMPLDPAQWWMHPAVVAVPSGANR